MKPSAYVRRVFMRIFPDFATAEEVNNVGFRLCQRHSLNPHTVFKAVFERGAMNIMGLYRGQSATYLLMILWDYLKQSEKARIDLTCLVKRISKILNEVKNMKTTGELRKCLAQVLVDARDGKLSGDALRGVIGAANQINMSLSAEIKMRHQLQSEGIALTGLGNMPIGNSEGD